jgi:type VI secretion system secreted protein Hcp
MAVDMFLKLGSIKGESADDKHKGEIEVLSWHWGATQTGTTHSGTGGGAGKANFQDVTITKYLDSSSPHLIDHVAKGTHIPEALLTVRKAGGKVLEYLKLKMNDVLVSSIQTGGSGHDERLTETLGLNFSKYEIVYTPQKADGSGDAAVQSKFDIAKNV